MSDQFRSTVVTINNPQGLHMRPAYLFAETAAKFDCSVELIKDNNRVDGKSVLGILTLGASQGTQITVEANGADADSAINTLEGLLASGFPASVQPGDIQSLPQTEGLRNSEGIQNPGYQS